MTAGYAAMSTNLSITAKGNIKNLKEEIDSKVPTNELLFWGQADNEENTLTVLKDKSGNNNDGIMYGFDNTNESGYTEEGLVFDGINDYIDIGLANYDFENSISYIVYVQFNTTPLSNKYFNIFNNQESAGGELSINSSNESYISIYDGTKYIAASNKDIIYKNIFYTIIGTYDGATLKIYCNNIPGNNRQLKINLLPSTMPMYIRANPENNMLPINFANMTLKEVMLYDRALTEEEVKNITEGFEKKYQ